MTDPIDTPPSAVVVAVGSSAERGNALGDHLAAAFSVELRSVHIDDASPSQETHGTELTPEEQLAAAICDRIPDDALLVIESEHADRWRGRHSVAEHTIDAFPGSAIAVGPHASGELPPGPIYVALDGSAAAETSLAVAARFANTLGRKLGFVQVVEEPLHPDPTGAVKASAEAYLRAITARVEQDFDVRGTSHEVVTSNDPVSAIAALAQEQAAALVVLSSRGDRSTQRSSMSRTAAGVIAEVACPVMVIAA
jgi:nucleotide-binding universal stress UspA family protein